MKLNIVRPIIFFDIESTGLDVSRDRIVEISMLKVMPDGEEIALTMRINPGIPIPEKSSEIHGIYDEDVKNEPTFETVSHKILDFFEDADIAGFNSNKFDLPLLVEEFLRCGMKFDIRNRVFVDVQTIFHRMEPRSLSAAYKMYCNKDLINAHSAEADTRATYEVLKAQLDRYQNTPYEDSKTGKVTYPIQNDIKVLSNFSQESRNVDFAGHIVFNDKDQEVFNFGKYKGQPVEQVFRLEPQYYDWMMKAEFPLYTKEVISLIKNRMF